MNCHLAMSSKRFMSLATDEMSFWILFLVAMTPTHQTISYGIEIGVDETKGENVSGGRDVDKT